MIFGIHYLSYTEKCHKQSQRQICCPFDFSQELLGVWMVSPLTLLASQVTQRYGICLLRQKMQEMPIQSLDQEDPLEKEMATCSCVLAWKTPGTEDPGGL